MYTVNAKGAVVVNDLNESHKKAGLTMQISHLRAQPTSPRPNHPC